MSSRSLLIVFMALGSLGAACKGKSPNTDKEPAPSTSPVTTASVAPSFAKKPIPPEPTPPMADQAAEAAKDAADLVNDKAYVALWDPAKKADLTLLLTSISFSLAALDQKGSVISQPALYEPIKAKKLDKAYSALLLASLATGSFPEHFVTKFQAHLAGTKSAPHAGVWSEWKGKGDPLHDYSALAFHLNRENPDYAREMIAARTKSGGPTKWDVFSVRDPLRPWLAREGAALSMLASLTKLTQAEAARFMELKSSPLGEDLGESVELSDLLKEYKSNEVRADGKYKGHVIRISGVATDIKKNAFDSIYLVITTGSEWAHPDVHCSVAKKLKDKAAQFDKGDKVSMRGRVKGMVLASVMIEDCEFEE